MSEDSRPEACAVCGDPHYVFPKVRVPLHTTLHMYRDPIPAVGFLCAACGLSNLVEVCPCCHRALLELAGSEMLLQYRNTYPLPMAPSR